MSCPKPCAEKKAEGKRQAAQRKARYRARALMCQWCAFAEHDDGDRWGVGNGGAIACTISGRPTREHIAGTEPTCPRGRHGDRFGHIRWAGLRWLGAPAPLRWISARWWLTGPLPGCGCTVIGKRTWNYSRLWWRHFLARSGVPVTFMIALPPLAAIVLIAAAGAYITRTRVIPSRPAKRPQAAKISKPPARRSEPGRQAWASTVRATTRPKISLTAPAASPH